MRLWAVLLALLLVPTVQAVPFETSLPERLQLRDGLLMVGHVTLPGGELSDPVVLGTVGFTFPSGTLTVCPVEARGDALTLVRSLQTTCDGGVAFRDATLRMGPGTDVRMAGAMPVQEMPAAVKMLSGGRMPLFVAALQTPDGLALGAPEGPIRFAVTDGSGSIHVESRDGDGWYNGTDWAFVHDGPGVHARSQGFGGALQDHQQVRLEPAGTPAVARLPDGFALLALQEHLLSADEREPRRNATDLLRTFGRVATFVDGSIVGSWNGTIDGRRVGAGVHLLRVSMLQGTLDEGVFSGEAEPELRVQDAQVALDGRSLQGPPYLLAAILWIAAVAIALVRKGADPMAGVRRAVRAGAWLGGLLLVDLWVLQRGLGTGALKAWFGTGHALGDALVLTTLLLVASGWSWLLLHQPLRVMADHIVTGRWQWLADAAAAVVWWVLLLLLPSATIAAALTWVRL